MDQPLDTRNRRRFALDFWSVQPNGLLVIDLTPLVAPAVLGEFRRRGGVSDSDGIEVCEVSSIFGLIKVLLRVQKKSSSYWFNLASPLSFSCQIVQYFLFLKGLTEIVLLSGLLPVEKNLATGSLPGLRPRLVRSIGYVFNRTKRLLARRGTLGIPRLIQQVISKFFRVLYLVLARTFKRSPIYVETGLSASKIHSETVRISSKVIHSHSFDFDTYIRLKREPVEKLVAYRYAVFLDEDMCFHTDFLYSKMSPPATPDIYFPLLRLLFAEIYRRYGLRVVVACHPRARYTSAQKKDFFGESLCFDEETAKLVKNACFVLAHSSTSLSFAALYMKPVNFLTSNQILQHPQGRFINLIASKLGSILINIDQIDSTTVFKTKLGRSDKVSYVQYVNDYVRHPSADRCLYSFEAIQKALRGSCP